MLAIEAPFPQYFDLDGSPLDAGFLYFGVANQNPETNPTTVFWDAAGTQPAAQPIRTITGFAARSGTPAVLYVPTDYSVTVRNKSGRRLPSSPSSANASNSAAILASLTAYQTLMASETGPANIGFQQNYVSAIAQLLSTKLSTIVSVSDWMTAQQVLDGQGGIVLPDITAAFTAAIAAFPHQGTPTFQQWKLIAPFGRYTISSTIQILNQQGGELHMGGCELIGNFAGPVMQVGDTTGSHDCLRFHIYGGALTQNSTAANSGAFLGQHMYGCSVRGMAAFGGRIAFSLDGNANLIDTLWAYGGRDSNIKASAQSNNESNTFLNCTSQQGFGYGYDLTVAAGAGGFTKIIGGYIEANASGGVLAVNSEKVVVDGVYFNLQNLASGVILGGTVGANYADPQVRVVNCRILGPSSGTPLFIQELTANAINAIYGGNTVESGNCNLYGSAPNSINERRRGDKVYVVNGDAFTGATGTTPPTGWAAGGGAPVFTIVASNSPYGSAAGLAVSVGGYAKQLLAFPLNALLRISCWAKTTGADATLQLYDSTVATQYGSVSTASASAVRLELYVSSTARTSAVAGELLLRNVAGSGAATFSNIVIEDMTN